MAWTTWADMYLKWLNAVSEKRIESFFTASVENAREMRTTYISVGSEIPKFTSYLKRMADQEALGVEDGDIFQSIGGC